MADQTLQKNQRKEWIDAGKFIAMIGVLIDHTDGMLYTDKRIAFLSYYSVSLFILLMGITSYYSFRKGIEKGSAAGWIEKKCGVIIAAYLEATLVYCYFRYGRIQLNTFLDHVIRFNAATGLYFVSLYLQLIIITPAVFHVFTLADQHKNRFLTEAAGFAVISIIARLTNYHTNIMDIYGGGGKLFGGHYLCLYYMGMWFGKYSSRISLSAKVKRIGFILSLLLAAACGIFIAEDRFRIDMLLNCGYGLNPPGISLCTYAVLIAAALYFLGELLSGRSVKIMEIPAFLGKHTLYVFLYHNLFLLFIIKSFVKATGFRIPNLAVRAFVYLAATYAGSMVLEAIFTFINKKTGKYFADAYRLNSGPADLQ